MTPLYNAFVYLVWFLATYYSVFLVLSMITFRKQVYSAPKHKLKDHSKMVSILIPAYNEKNGIAKTIRSLKKVTYSSVEFIILNDGSKDETADIVRANIRGDSRFRFIDNKKNKGKAATLNQGISLANGEYIACMDADSIIEPGIIQKTLPFFDDEKVGAVTVSVKVHKPKSLLDRLIQIEYILGLSLFLKIFSFYNCIFVTPGPYSIYRREVLETIGGFDPSNITEDLEIAYRIHKAGYSIENCMDAQVSTILPPSFKEIYVQRKRWYSGAILTLYQHRDVIFNKRYKAFGFFMPINYTLIFLGIILFLSTLYLTLSKMFKELFLYRHTGFNFFEHFSLSLDILTYGRINFLGMTLFAAIFILLFLGLYVAQKRISTLKKGIMLYPFLFFLYQIFWISSMISVVLRKKVRWR